MAMLITGPLADKLIEPAFIRSDFWLANLLAPVMGTGTGVGMGFIIAFSGLLVALVGVVPFFIPVIKNVETILPDHQTEVN